MLLTNTVHPPGGASAVLAATDSVITAMGWYFVGLVLWGTTLMIIVGLVINNIQRQFPIYWWTPLDVRKAKIRDEEVVPDATGGLEPKESTEEQHYNRKGDRIEINGARLVLPDDMSLDAEETRVLEKLQERLRKRADEKREDMDVEKTEAESERSSTEFTMVQSNSGSSHGI
jgi:hypothetical protein